MREREREGEREREIVKLITIKTSKIKKENHPSMLSNFYVSSPNIKD